MKSKISIIIVFFSLLSIGAKAQTPDTTRYMLQNDINVAKKEAGTPMVEAKRLALISSARLKTSKPCSRNEF